MYLQFHIMRQEIELAYDEDGIPYDKPIEDAYVLKKYAINLRECKIVSFESTKILDVERTLVYLSDGEVVISVKTFEKFKSDILPKYDHLLKQLSIIN